MSGGIGTCRTCGAAVIWITTPAGRPMPLEAKGETMYLPGPPAKAVTAHRSHFSSCPQAKDWRKPPEPPTRRRCESVSGQGLRCGRESGHSEDHNALIASDLPWARSK